MTPYETDERAVQRVLESLGEGEKIGHETARTIAADYNEGGVALVYAFVSTGAMLGEVEELWNALMWNGSLYESADNRQTDALDALKAYLDDRAETGDTGPVEGWAGMWVCKHVDYPHETGDLDTCWCSFDAGE